MLLPIFWIFVFVGIRPTFGESRSVDETLGEFVMDAISSMFGPSSVTALLCVNDVDGFRFAKQMSQNRVMHDLRVSIEGFDGIDPVGLASRINHQSSFVLDLECPGALDILVKASSSRMFVAPAQWLILQDVRSTEKPDNASWNATNSIDRDDVTWIHKTLGNLTMFPDSNVILGRRMNDDFFRVLSPYRPSSQRDLILEDRGYWTRDRGLILRNRHAASRRRRDLQGTALKSCLVITNPDTHNHLEDYGAKHVDTTTKASYPWVRHLVNRMNATVTFVVRDSWGYRGKNGTWTGMIGLLNEREIDLGGTATFIDVHRLGVVDYIQLYAPTRIKFIFRRPPLSHVSNLFTLPFRRNVWIAIGILLVIVMGLLWLAMAWEFKIKSIERSSMSRWTGIVDEEPSLSNDLLVIIGAVFQQGSSYEPSAIPTRMIVLMLLFAALSLYVSYTANIVGLLQATTTSINTPRDLMNSPLKIGVFDIVYCRHYFAAFQDPERKEFYEKLVKGKENVWMSLEEGIRNVKKGLFAFHVPVNAGYDMMQKTYDEDEKCGLHEIDYLKMLNPTLVVQHQSPYLEIVRVGALLIREAGLKHRETSRLFEEKPICHGHNSFLSVGIIECYAALMSIAYGIGITFGVLLLEIIWHKWESSNSEEDKTTDVEFVE